MKNSADLGGFYTPRPSASVDNTSTCRILHILQKPNSIIARYKSAFMKQLSSMDLEFKGIQSF